MTQPSDNKTIVTVFAKLSASINILKFRRQDDNQLITFGNHVILGRDLILVTEMSRPCNYLCQTMSQALKVYDVHLNSHLMFVSNNISIDHCCSLGQRLQLYTCIRGFDTDTSATWWSVVAGAAMDQSEPATGAHDTRGVAGRSRGGTRADG